MDHIHRSFIWRLIRAIILAELHELYSSGMHEHLKSLWTHKQTKILTKKKETGRRSNKAILGALTYIESLSDSEGGQMAIALFSACG